MTTRTELEAMLVDAKEKRHLLVTGRAPRVLVDQNGERVEFNHASVSKLSQYIAELERQLLSMSGGAGQTGRPIKVWI